MLLEKVCAVGQRCALVKVLIENTNKTRLILTKANILVFASTLNSSCTFLLITLFHQKKNKYGDHWNHYNEDNWIVVNIESVDSDNEVNDNLLQR